MNEKEFLQTIGYHKKMLANLKKYLTLGMVLSATMVLIIVSTSHKIIGTILLFLSIMWVLTVGYAIYKGNKKATSIIDAYEKQMKERD